MDVKLWILHIKTLDFCKGYLKPLDLSLGYYTILWAGGDGYVKK